MFSFVTGISVNGGCFPEYDPQDEEDSLRSSLFGMNRPINCTVLCQVEAVPGGGTVIFNPCLGTALRKF